MKEINKNSFDIVSLVAAVDVMLAHTIANAGGGRKLLFWRFLAPGPAVAVMFAVSGFLVTASYERSSKTLDFYKKRIMRIYPPLIAAVVIPVILYLCFGLLPFKPVQILVECVKTICIGSFGKYTVPVGAVGNGSLWTIVIQMQFYFLTPLLFRLLKNIRIAVVLFVAMLSVNLLSLRIEGILTGTVERLYSLTCLPYLYMYLFGMIIYIYREKLLEKLQNSLVPLLVCYALIHWVFALDLRFTWKYINPVSALLIMSIAIGAAFRFVNHRMKWDVSYGIYLWHLPVFDFVHIILGIDYSAGLLLLTWCITFIVAILVNQLMNKLMKRDLPDSE